MIILPSERRCRYDGAPLDPLASQIERAESQATQLETLAITASKSTGATVILCNFALPPYYDVGPIRATSLASDYSFRKYVNLQLGWRSASKFIICDVEFIANRIGSLRATDPRGWYESKQPYSPEMIIQVAKECGKLISGQRLASKKVVVLDLDNTLWGGVVGDDGLDEIEIGTTSPRGEAFRDFQQYLLSLSSRGILLCVCSKNDRERALEPFQSHPEMILRAEDIVNFKANWEPKSDNIRQIASELNLGLDSFVFLDDNPAEVEIVRQFVPEVTSVCLGDDPSRFIPLLKDSGLFEIRSLTTEDLSRVSLYQQEAKRQNLLTTSTDMESYLTSLEMVATISKFTVADAPRISQLINKSNQFNVTTRRRSEEEVIQIVNDNRFAAFTIRLADKFGDHGLIAIVIAKIDSSDFQIDTWLMSCRVLKRGVEEETLNEIIRLGIDSGCDKVIGTFLRTAKNEMVADLYPRMGFLKNSESESDFTLHLQDALPRKSCIKVQHV